MNEDIKNFKFLVTTLMKNAKQDHRATKIETLVNSCQTTRTSNTSELDQKELHDVENICEEVKPQLR